MNFVSLGDLDEIRVIAQIGFSVVARVEKLLPLPAGDREVALMICD